jgi:hypothetical protein
MRICWPQFGHTVLSQLLRTVLWFPTKCKERKSHLLDRGNCYPYCPDSFGLIFQALGPTGAIQESACAGKIFNAVPSASVRERDLSAAFRIVLDLESDWVCVGSWGNSLKSESVTLSNPVIL